MRFGRCCLAARWLWAARRTELFDWRWHRVVVQFSVPFKPGICDVVTSGRVGLSFLGSVWPRPGCYSSLTLSSTFSPLKTRRAFHDSDSVVIGIIAILISIILPSIIAVRSAGDNLAAARRNPHHHAGLPASRARPSRLSPARRRASGGLPQCGIQNVTPSPGIRIGSVTATPSRAGRMWSRRCRLRSRQSLDCDQAGLQQLVQLDTQLNDNRGVWQMFMRPLTPWNATTGVDASTPGSARARCMVIAMEARRLTCGRATATSRSMKACSVTTTAPITATSREISRINRPSELMLFCARRSCEQHRSAFRRPVSISVDHDDAVCHRHDAVTLADVLANNKRRTEPAQVRSEPRQQEAEPTLSSPMATPKPSHYSERIARIHLTSR